MKTLSFRERFQGLSALLHSRRWLVKRAFGTALAGSLLFALAERSGSLDGDLRGSLGILALLLLSAVLPLLVAGEDTFRETPGGRSFRESLLAGPIGPLALPAMVHLGSFVLVLTMLLGATPGLVLADLSFSWLRVGALAALFGGLWAGFSCVAACGNSPASWLPLLLGVPGLWLMAPLATGYGESSAIPLAIWTGLFTLALTGFLLGLPYFLYSRPRHHWAEKATLAPASTRDAALSLFALGLCLIPFMGLGWGALVAAPGAALWARARIRRTPPERRRLVGHFRVGAQACLLVCLPFFVTGLIGDAYYFEQGANYDPDRHPHGVDAPQGGRRAVLLASSASTWGARVRSSSQLSSFASAEGLGRTLVLDAAGQVEFVFPQRFSVLSRYAWSLDGRYLAVHDQTIGRMQFGLPQRVGRVLRRTAELGDRLERHFQQRVQGTYVLDTQTGSLTRYPVLELREGWSEPSQLVEHSLGLGGQHVLANGRGHEVETNERVLVVGYTAEGAVLRGEEGDLLFSAQGLSPR